MKMERKKKEGKISNPPSKKIIGKWNKNDQGFDKTDSSRMLEGWNGRKIS